MVNVEKQRHRAELARQVCIDQIDNRVGYLEEGRIPLLEDRVGYLDEDRIPLLEERIESLEYQMESLRYLMVDIIEGRIVRGAGFEPTDPCGKRS